MAKKYSPVRRDEVDDIHWARRWDRTPGRPRTLTMVRPVGVVDIGGQPSLGWAGNRDRTSRWLGTVQTVHCLGLVGFGAQSTG